MGEHIGLSNVYRTLQLTYQRTDLLRLSNTDPNGARVEILIPVKRDNNENTDR
jgi:sensor histidine kinase YesM